MSDRLWLPPSARRRLKGQRPDSRDYKDISAIEGLRGLSYDAFISAMREVWEDQYTPAERQGPITFEHYLGLSLDTMHWRISSDIPDRAKQGIITETEAEDAIGVYRRLIGFERNYLRGKGKL